MLGSFVLAFSLGMVAASFNYPESPDNGWDGTCISGEMQSPIDLKSNMTATVHAPITFKNYFNGPFNKHFKGLLKFNGNSVYWYPNAKDDSKIYGGKHWRYKAPSIRDGPYGGSTHTHAYYLHAINFHWGTVGNDATGSEHTVDGMQYPLEMHMVHVEDEFIGEDGEIDWAGALSDGTGLAVLGILFYVDPMKPQNQEPLEVIDDAAWEFHHHIGGHKHEEEDEMPLPKRSIDEMLEERKAARLEHTHDMNMRSLMFGMNSLAAQQKKRDAEAGQTQKITLNVGAFIRKATNRGADKTMSTYWTYKGSLTTPTCNEVVTWVVFERALPIAQVQANSFSSIISNNFRESRDATEAHNVQYLIHKDIEGNGNC